MSPHLAADRRQLKLSDCCVARTPTASPGEHEMASGGVCWACCQVFLLGRRAVRLPMGPALLSAASLFVREEGVASASCPYALGLPNQTLRRDVFSKHVSPSGLCGNEPWASVGHQAGSLCVEAWRALCRSQRAFSADTVQFPSGACPGQLDSCLSSTVPCFLRTSLELEWEGSLPAVSQNTRMN